MMPPSYPIKTLFLVLAASFLVIGIAQASYQQIYNTSTVQASNLTENSTTSTSYVHISVLTIPSNISGNFTISFEIKRTIAGTGYGRIYKNGAAYGTEQSTASGTYATKSELFTGVFNTTDNVEIRGYIAANSVYIDTVELKYDNVSAPTITSPANNSAQTSRTVNATWTGTSPFQYNFSRNANCSSPYITGTTSNSFTGNKTLLAGTNYLCVRGYNSTEDSITNTSMVYFYIADTYYQMDATQNNWNNYTFENNRFRSDNRIVPNDSFMGYTHKWELYEGSGTVINDEAGTNDGYLVGATWNTSGGVDFNGTTSLQVIGISDIVSSQNFSQFAKFYKVGISTGTSSSVMSCDNYDGVVGRNHTSLDSHVNSNASASAIEGQSLGGGSNQKLLWWNPNGTLSTIGAVRALGTTTGYKDGVSQGTISVTSGITDFKNCRMGVHYWSGVNQTSTTLNGTLLWAEWLNREANATEISQISSQSVIYSTNTTFTNTTNGTSQFIGFVLSVAGSVGTYNYSVYVRNNSRNEDWTLVASSQTGNNKYFGFNETNISVRLNMKSSDILNRGIIWGIGYYYQSLYTISGYVTNYSDDAVVSGATVVFPYGSTTTDSNGYYQLEGQENQIENISIVAGKTGYKALGRFVNSSVLNSSYLLTNFNFSLNESDTYIPNMILEEANYGVQRYINLVNESGHVVILDDIDNPFLLGGSGQAEPQISASASFVFDKGLNQTPEFLEKILRIQNHYMKLWDSSISSDIYQINDIDFEHTVVYLTDGIIRLQPYVDSEQNNYFIDHASGFNDSLWTQDYDYNASNYINNWHLYGINGMCNLDILSSLDCSDNPMINNVTQLFSEQVNDKGFLYLAEGKSYSSNYNLVNTYNGYNLINKGYVNQTFFDAVNKTYAITMNTTLQNNEQLPLGRGHHQMSSYTQLFFYPMLLSNMGIGDAGKHYRFIDKTFQKLRMFKYYPSDAYWNGTYYQSHNFYDPTERVGACTYCDFTTVNTFDIYWMAYAGYFWNTSVIEKEETYGNFDDLNVSVPVTSNQSGIVVTNLGNYSIYLYPIYRVSFFEDGLYQSNNNSDLYPRIFYVTKRDSLNFSLAPNVETNINATRQRWQNGMTFNNESKKMNFTSWGDDYLLFPSPDFTNITYSYGSNFLWMNWTNVTLMDSSVIDSINMSVVHDNDNDLLNFTVRIDFNETGNPINHMEYGLWFMQDDNLTKASMSLGADSITWKRGRETVNVTNVVATGGDVNIMKAPSDYAGYGTYGFYNLTYLTGNVTSSPYILTYTYEEDTTNEYAFALNQPPGIFTYSPETPLTTAVNSMSQYTVVGTQTLDWTWFINGTSVQTNSSVVGGDDVLYINTSSIAGFWNLSAIGCNAQGCAMQTWDWNVIEPFISKIIRRLIIID